MDNGYSIIFQREDNVVISLLIHRTEHRISRGVAIFINDYVQSNDKYKNFFYKEAINEIKENNLNIDIIYDKLSNMNKVA